MKVMILTKLSEAPENMVPPSEEAILAMHNYNEALIAAGILKDQVYGGLMPSKFAKRLQYKGKNLTVTDGPFTETKEVVAGFALWEVKSFDEALEWARKCPVMMDCTVKCPCSAEMLIPWVHFKCELDRRTHRAGASLLGRAPETGYTAGV
jgi:hypothetical protein